MRMNYTGISPSATFVNAYEVIKKYYPNSIEQIEDEFAKLLLNPNCGALIRGFHPAQIRKLRIGLKKYQIGKSGGLRLIYLVVASNIIKLFIYSKRHYEGEEWVYKSVLKSLKEHSESIGTAGGE